MACIKRLVLDVLKPHHPNAVDFASALADRGKNIRIKLSVEEIDEKTETIIVIVEGEDINFDIISKHIAELGGSVHSIDEVEVTGHTNTEPSNDT